MGTMNIALCAAARGLLYQVVVVLLPAASIHLMFG
jgi:hypothetical protein